MACATCRNVSAHCTPDVGTMYVGKADGLDSLVGSLLQTFFLELADPIHLPLSTPALGAKPLRAPPPSLSLTLFGGFKVSLNVSVGQPGQATCISVDHSISPALSESCEEERTAYKQSIQ